jgi:hypothetical protein
MIAANRTAGRWIPALWPRRRDQAAPTHTSSKATSTEEQDDHTDAGSLTCDLAPSKNADPLADASAQPPKLSTWLLGYPQIVIFRCRSAVATRRSVWWRHAVAT